MAKIAGVSKKGRVLSLKICLLSYRCNPYSGGQGIYLKYLSEELVRQGMEVHVIAGPPYPVPMKGVTVHRVHNNHYSTREGFNIITGNHPLDILSPLNFYEFLSTRTGAFPEIGTFGIRAFRLLKELHARHRFHLIHDNQSLGYGLLLMKALGVPVFATIHHPLPIDLANDLERFISFKRKARTVMFYPLLMQEFVSRRLDRIISVSENSRAMIHEHFGVDPAKISVVHNGIDREIFSGAGAGKRKRTVIFVGNVEDGKKGFAYLLKAMRHVREGWELIAVDGGSVHHRITRGLVDTLGVSGRVRFTGKIGTDELVRLYGQASIAVVPSVYEGFGFPAGEAMACGVPVISSDGGALPEVVGDCGIIVPARDAGALAGAINRLIDNPSLRKKMAAAGVQRVEREFSWEGAARKLIAIYRDLLRERG